MSLLHIAIIVFEVVALIALSVFIYRTIREGWEIMKDNYDGE